MGKDTREHTFLMKEKYYPHIVQALPMTEKVLFNYIGKYRDRNNTLLSNPYPDALVFNTRGEDVDILFRVSNINRAEMKKDVAKIELPGDVTEKKSLNDVNIIFILLIRYYMTVKDADKLNAIMLYFAYSIYGLRFNVSFRPYGANQAVMRYCVNNLSEKFILKKYGSIDKWLTHTFMVSMITYRERFERLSDRDIDEIISALFTRISNALKKIRDEYGKVYKEKKVILESDAFIGDTQVQVEQKSYTSEIEAYALEYTQDFFSTKPDAKRILFAAKTTNIAVDELQVTIDKVFDNADVKEMKAFLQCLFTIYFQSITEDNINRVNVRNFKFVQTMDSIFRKGNSKDKNILQAKELIDGWLRRGSATYRKTTRIPTISEYRRGVYMYFLLLIAGIG